VPLPPGLQGPEHLQRLRHHALERRHELARGVGHPCLGCSEPDFWDAGGFYQALSVPTANATHTLGVAGIAGAVVGGVAATLAKKQQRQAVADREPVTIEQLEQRL
jgi:hydrogenase small subunit